MSLIKVGSRKSYFFPPDYLPSDVISTEDDVEEIISLLCLNSGMESFHVLPNFIPSCLIPPKGYAAKIRKDAKFNSDFLMTKVFGVISLQELDLTDTEWDRIKSSENFDDLFRSCFPFSSENSPSFLDDTPTTGWSPSLSREEGRIGIYETRIEKNGIEKVVKVLICKSYLPDETYNQFHDWCVDFQKQIENKKVTMRSAPTVKGGILDLTTYKSNTLLSTATDMAFNISDEVKIRDMFGEKSFIARLLELSKENNRRLMTIFQELLGIGFKDVKPNKWPQTTASITEAFYRTPAEIFTNKEIAKKFKELLAEGKQGLGTEYEETEMYRFPKSVEGKTPTSIRFEDLISALNWWPKGAPIYPFTCLPGYRIDDPTSQNIKKLGSNYPHSRLIEIEKLKGYPLGWALLTYRLYVCEDPEKEKQFQDEVVKKFATNYHLHPLTFKPNIETDFDTFRLELSGSVIWYSNSTSTYNPSHGFLVEGPIDTGYFLFNADLSENTNSLFSRNKTTSGGAGIQNDHLHSFPVIFPLTAHPEKQISEDTLVKFTSPLFGGDAVVTSKYAAGTNSSKRPPLQLLSTPILPADPVSANYPQPPMLPAGVSAIKTFSSKLNIHQDPITFHPRRVFISEESGLVSQSRYELLRLC